MAEIMSGPYFAEEEWSYGYGGGPHIGIRANDPRAGMSGETIQVLRVMSLDRGNERDEDGKPLESSEYMANVRAALALPELVKAARAIIYGNPSGVSDAMERLKAAVDLADDGPVLWMEDGDYCDECSRWMPKSELSPMPASTLGIELQYCRECRETPLYSPEEEARINEREMWGRP